MMDYITELMLELVSKAAGNKATADGLHYWEILDLKSGGVWSFRRLESSLDVAWRPMIDVFPDAFTLHLIQERDSIFAETSRSPALESVERAKMRRLGIFLLSATEGMKLPDCVHRELNDLFYPFSKESYMKGALVEAGLSWDTEPREELKNGAWERSSEPRLVRDIGLSHPEPAVKEAFEKAKRMYEGKALDDQKDPSKVN